MTLRATFTRSAAVLALIAAPAWTGGLEWNINRAGSDFRWFDLDGGADACSSACQADQRCRSFTWVKPGVQGRRARCWLKGAVPAASHNTDCISGVMGPPEAVAAGGRGGAPAGDWGVWAYRLGADAGPWQPCDIQYVAARRPARYDTAANYVLVRNADTRFASDQFVSLFSRYYDDQPDYVVKMTPCNPDTIVTAKPPVGLAHVAGSGGLEYNTNRWGSDYRNFELDSGPAACQDACMREAACRSFTWVKPGVQGRRAHCWLKDSVPGPSRNTDCTSGVK